MPDEPPALPSDAGAPEGGPAAPEEADPMLYCPVCSKRLTVWMCKLVCERCGYYMSCADYY